MSPQKSAPKSWSARAAALSILIDVVENKRSLSSGFDNEFRHINEQDQALVQELVYGTCRWYFALLETIQSHLHRPLKKKDQRAYILMALGAYQLYFTRIPVHAALNETVAVADRVGLGSLKSLINAILRQLSREDKPDVESLTASSHPAWIASKLEHNWPEQHLDIMFENNQRPPMTLRINSQRTDREQYGSLLDEQGIAFRHCESSPIGLTLDYPVNVHELPRFSDGYVSVQDEAAQLCTLLLDLQPGQKVLDACAAPGGKTCAILEQEPDIDLLALDADAMRSKRIDENLDRLKLTCSVKTGRAEDTADWWDQTPFDRILVDAPCSATGVIRRHPDIKLLREQNDIVALASLQLKILAALWKTLASGGKLVYATCSVFPQENSRVIERFIKSEPGARLIPIHADWGVDTGFGRQLFPKSQAHDGFFYACLEKSS